MTKQKISLQAFALTALVAALPFSAVAQGKPAPQRVIVQLQSILPQVAVDRADARMNSPQQFGRMRAEVVGHVQRLERAHGFQSRRGFGHAVNGFAAELTPDQIAKLKQDPAVKLVEPDVVVKAIAQTLPYGIQTAGATTSPAARAGDGLDNATGLSNVRVFVIDTGVAAHPDLNVVERLNYVGDGIEGDCNGHGTHVAGTIGAKDDTNYVVGMAPGVGISALKVLDCAGSGYASSLIAAFDYAASQAAANPSVKYVANASVGFPTGTQISTLDTSVKNAVAAGVVVAVAAGNSGDNTCSTTMVQLSSATEGRGVMAVSAVDSAGREASFSSFGPCVASWAPGVSVTSTSNAGALASMSGTSMAAPHVAGAAAVVRAVNPAYTPAQVDTALKSLAKPLTTLSKDGRAIKHLDISKVGATVVAPEPVLTSVVRVDTPALDFGTVKTRSSVVRRQAWFTNIGTANMTLTGMSGLPAGLAVITSTCNRVAPGASCAVTLEMATTKRNSFSTTVTTVGANTNGKFTVKGTVQ